MDDVLLSQAALFDGLTDEGRRRLSAIARRRVLEANEYLFLLGDDAIDFHVLVKGKVDLCLPLRVHGEVKDVSVESVNPGQTLGWSALVKPYRYTLSAHAIEPSEVIGLARRDLLHLFDADPRMGYAFFTKVAEVVGVRLHTFQALWVRELQRTLESEAQRHGAAPPAHA